MEEIGAYERTRTAWEEASQKHVREYDEMLEEARTARLLPIEEATLAPVIHGARVVHPQSGHGIDDHALVRLGARSVLGLDYSPTAIGAAQRRADELHAPIRYDLAELPDSEAGGGAFDLVYTGKGALIWMPDLGAWATEMARLLASGGYLFVYEAHPLEPLWEWDAERIGIRADRNYFAATHTNDSFPARGATQYQYTLAEIVMTVQGAGFTLEHLAEHPDPFWAPANVESASWDGRLPNAFSLLARLAE